MRAAGEQLASATPIFDSLCAEYRRLFRALPWDRSGEEELRFGWFTTRYGGGTAPRSHGPAALPPGGGDPGSHPL